MSAIAARDTVIKFVRQLRKPVLAISFLCATSICSAAPKFEIRCLDGKSRVASAISIADGGALTIEGERAIVSGDWYSIRRTDIPLPPWPLTAHIELTNGDRVAGSIVAADGDSLTFAPAASPNRHLRFPTSSIRVLWMSRQDEREPSWLNKQRTRDVLQSRNGDLATGILLTIDKSTDRVRFQADGKDKEWELSKLAAIGFNTDLARVRRAKGLFFCLTLVDGTRLSAVSVTSEGKLWKATTWTKNELSIPTEKIVSIDVEQGKAVSIADLKPTRYEHQTSDGEQLALASDRCVSGAALTLKTTMGESTFARGIGLHSECTIAYSLAGKYRRFEALAGLDARSGTRGDVTLVVLVDGKERELPRGGRLVFSEGPLSLQLDVTGAKELTIVVRSGRGGTVQDHVNLVDALLIP